MPTANFLAAAGKAVREPVVIMAVESINAIRVASTTEADWNAAKSNSNINTSTEPGTIFPITNGDETYSGNYDTLETFYEKKYAYMGDPNYTYYTAHLSPNSRIVAITCNYTISFNGAIATVDLQTSPDNSSWTTRASKDYDENNSNEGIYQEISCSLTAGQYYCRLKLTLVSGYYEFADVQVGWRGITWTHQTLYLTTASLQTKSLDLGLTPATPSIIQIDDTVPAGAAISYTARGSNNNSTWTNLGAVVDGGSLAAYRYYDVTATLTTDGHATPRVSEIRISGGDSQFDYYSTHKDQPVNGARPYLLEGSLSSLTSKTDLIEQPTTGEVSLKLAWTEKTSDMIAAGYLKNKTVAIKIGFPGLASVDYEPYFTGTWFDHSDNHEKMEITVKTRDVWKQFKTKIPEESYFTDTDGNKIDGKVYTLSGNIIDVLIAILDASGVPDRYIDRTTITALEAAHFSGTDWDIRRDLTESTEVKKLLTELTVSAGLIPAITPEGKYTLKHYDTLVAGSATPLDARMIKFSAIEGGQKELFTRQAIYYQLIAGKSGGSKEDYNKGYLYTNAAAELAWGESYTREWLDPWGLSPAALHKLAERLDGWYANPRYTVRAENVPPRYIGVNSGDLVSVDWLRLPATTANWPGYSSDALFMVTGKTIHPKDLSLSFELLQVAEITYQAGSIPTYPTWGVFPPVTGLTLTETTTSSAEGVVLYHGLSVNFIRPVDFRYGGAQVWVKEGLADWYYHSFISLSGPDPNRSIFVAAEYATDYQVAVLTVNAAGMVMDLDDAPTESITTGADPGTLLKPSVTLTLYRRTATDSTTGLAPVAADGDATYTFADATLIDLPANWFTTIPASDPAAIFVTRPAMMIYSTTTRIEFQDILSAYDFIVAGNVLYVYVGAVEWIKYIPPESPNSATLVFRDGEAELLLTGLNSMTLAGVSVPTTLGPIVATLSPTTSGGDILWHITAVASSLEPTATIPWDSWTDPQTLSINGISAAEVTVYTRDVPSAAPTGGTYSFGAAVPLVAVPLSSGDPVTWSAEVPDDDGSPLYVSKAVVTSASGTTATPIAVWSTPAIMASSGGGSSTATPTSDGLMSKEDKVKLDNSPAVYITESYIPIRAAAAIFLTQGANEGHILAATNKHLYKSTDGGQTWGTAPLASFGQAVWKVKLYEDVAGNLFYSISGGTTALPEAQAGLFRSTDDGANWTRVIGPATETMSAAEYSDTSWNIGDYVVPTTRNYMVYKVTTGGTSIAEPTWPAIKGQTVTSGAVVFECQGTLDISAGQFVWDIEQADNGTLFATIYTLGAGVNYRGTILLKSSNGINWTDATTAIMNVPWRAHGHVLAKSSDGDLWLTLSENQVPKTVWSSNTAYTVQSKVTNPSNANQMFRCLKPGTSGGSAPSWVTSSIGVQTNDGSVVWDYLGNPDWSNSSPLVMVSVDNGVNWTVDLNFNTSMKDGESTTGMFAFSATELLPLASGELLLVIERGGWGDIYRRATNGTYTRVRHAPQPLDTYGLYDAEPLTYDINDNINTPSFPTDYWTSNTYGLVSVNGVVIAFLGNESGYLISLDDGLTWQKRQLAQQMSPGGFFGASNLYGDRIIGIYRDDAGTGGFWNATANYSNAIVLDITTAATISVIPLPPDPIPKGAWHDHADGAGAVIPLAGLGSDVLALLEAGGGAWTYDPDEHTVILTTITDFVGIGTDTPTTPIHVVSTTVAPLLLERSSSVTTDVTHCAAFLNRDTTNNNSTGFTFNSVDSGGTAFIGAAFYAKFTEHANGSESANFHIETQISGNRITRLLIDSAGTKVTGKLETTEGIKFADTTVQTTAATPYTLPKASATNLGGVYVDPGYGIKIDSAGIISANNDTTGTSTSESLPAAASTVKAINDKLNAASLTATYLPRWSGTLFENSQIISNTYGVGINSASTGYALEVNSAANAANVVQAYNTNTGASASSQIVSKSDSALLAINTYSSGRTATRYGITGAGYADIVSTIGNGLLIGTNTLAKPIVFGTNSLERLRITSDGMTRFSNQATAPANNAAGTVGDMIVDAANGYVYFCTGLGGTSNWKRIAMSTY